jgi:hypothetical protein
MLTHTTAGTEQRTPALIAEAALPRMSNAALDVLFRSSPAGDVPNGSVRGTALLFPGTVFGSMLGRLIYPFVWQGKVFDRRQGVLRNKVTKFRIRAIKADVSTGPSWVDGKPCTVIDYSHTSLVARMVRDEIRIVSPHLYLGVVWLWRRRAAWFAVRESHQQADAVRRRACGKSTPISARQRSAVTSPQTS